METALLLKKLETGLAGGDSVGEVDRVLIAIQKAAVTTTAISALERLASRQDMKDDGPYSWRVNKSKLIGKRLEFLTPALEYPRVLMFPAAQVLAAARLVTGRPGPVERAALVCTVLGSSGALSVHHHYGSDGADQVSFMTLLTTLMAQAFPHDERARRACLRMIAFHTCLSYAASGAVKLASPTWRSGRAIPGVTRTATFGDESAYRLTQMHPLVPKVLSWTVILGELAFPLALITPKPVSRGILAAMSMFHLANSRVMGLNRFPIAFGATYPAVDFVRRES